MRRELLVNCAMQQHCRVVSKVSSRERRGLGAFQGRTKDLAQSDPGKPGWKVSGPESPGRARHWAPKRGERGS